MIPMQASISIFGRPVLLLFYSVYVLYLALTCLQLRYEVHMVHGGLGLTHSTDIVSWLAFKAYKVVPFVEELRVLTDWTVTRTSLNFFMWMKLEDAHQNLYQTQCDMEARRYFEPAAQRPD